MRKRYWPLLGLGIAGLAAGAAFMDMHFFPPAHIIAPVLTTRAQGVAPASSPVEMDADVEYTAVDQEAIKRIYASFAVGDFARALTLADEAATKDGFSDGFHGWLRAQLPALLVSAGWARLKVGDCDQALVLLMRASAMKRSQEATKGLAVCYYKQKNMVAAHEHFQNYLAGAPADGEMQLLYTDVLESEGRFGEAVGILTQLVAAAAHPATPPDPAAVPLDKQALNDRLASMEGRNEESVLEQAETSHNFHLTYRAGDHEDLVSFVLTTLEEGLDEYNEQYGLPPPLSPIEVVLYPAEAFHKVVTYGPSWSEGLYDGRLRIPVPSRDLQPADFAELQVVLRHELVHALLALVNDSRTLPPWFDEGLAQRLSCAGRACGTFAFGAQPGQFLSPQSFLTPYLALSAVNAGRAYQQSLFLILNLENASGDPGALRKVISGLSSNSNLASDALLAPVNLSFANLYGYAANAWNRGVVPGH